MIMTSVEIKVASFQAAAARRAAGKPTWAHTIRLNGLMVDDAATFEYKRDNLARILLASKWVKEMEEYSDLPRLIEEMGEAEGVENFNYLLSLVYDEADVDRVWIQR
jgi:hypothetical protein